MKTTEKHIILVGLNTYKAAKVATYLYQEFGFSLDEIIPRGVVNESANVISIYRKVENITYTTEQDFIFDLNECSLEDIAQIAYKVVSEASTYYLREIQNKGFLFQ